MLWQRGDSLGLSQPSLAAPLLVLSQLLFVICPAFLKNNLSKVERGTG